MRSAPGLAIWLRAREALAADCPGLYTVDTKVSGLLPPGAARMKLIRGLQNLRTDQQGSVVTIGTYDGLHLGHQLLLRRLAEHGARVARPTMMLTFEPMPSEFFARLNPPPRLTSLR